MLNYRKPIIKNYFPQHLGIISEIAEMYLNLSVLNGDENILEPLVQRKDHEFSNHQLM